MDEIAAHQPAGLPSVAQTRLAVKVVSLLYKRKSELIAYLDADYPADAYPSWLGQGFEPRCGVDLVTINVAPSLIMSPTLMPMRNSIWRSDGTSVFRPAISTAHRTASATLAKLRTGRMSIV